MAALSEEVKTFIVQRLACFDTPTQVAVAVKEEFGLEVSRQQVHTYSPGKGRRVHEKWVELHKATRAAYLKDTAAIGISHRAHRLARRERLIDQAEHMGTVALVGQLLEQAAKEMGEAFTNRKVLQGVAKRPVVFRMKLNPNGAPSAPASAE